MKALLQKIQYEIEQNPINLTHAYRVEEKEGFLEMPQLRSGSVIGGAEFKSILKGKSKRENLSRIGSLIEKANQRNISI